MELGDEVQRAVDVLMRFVLSTRSIVTIASGTDDGRSAGVLVCHPAPSLAAAEDLVEELREILEASGAARQDVSFGTPEAPHS